MTWQPLEDIFRGAISGTCHSASVRSGWSGCSTAVGPLNRVPWFEEDGRELFEAACQLDLEGIVGEAEGRPLQAGDHLVQDQKPDVHPGR
jgi:hypothetical protein